MISQLYNNPIKNLDGFSSLRTLALCLIELIIAGCAEFGLGRNGIDSNKPVLATVNGKAIETKNIPPKPQRRANKTLVNAPRGENTRIIEAFGGVYSNQNLENQIARIVSKLVAKSEVPSQDFQITILNSPAVNAFALPGGLLYVTRGLLTLANDASEVAAVLAHEMAHITSKHGQARLKKARKAELISKAVEGVISDSSTLESIQQRGQLSFAAFTQAQELDADVIDAMQVLRAMTPMLLQDFLRPWLNIKIIAQQRLLQTRQQLKTSYLLTRQHHGGFNKRVFPPDNLAPPVLAREIAIHI